MFGAQGLATARPRPDRNAICVARVLCIGGLILIHMAPYSDPKPFASAGAGAQWTYAYVVQLLARASVPLLSVVSGFLLASSLSTARLWKTAIAKRIRSLLIPLVLWNAISLAWSAIVSGQAAPQGVLGWSNALVGVTSFPALDPLHFLRDLFLCALAAPLLAQVLRRVGWWAPAALMVLCLGGWQRPLILSDSILPFFTAGLGLGLGLLQARPPKAWIIILAGLTTPAVAAALVVAQTKDAGPYIDAVSQMMLFAQRIAGAALFWLVATRLAKAPFGALLTKAEPVAFLVFCSHPFVIAGAWALYKMMGFDLVSPAYVVFAAAAPFVCFAAAILIAAVGRRLAPWPLAVLTGGKAAAPVAAA